MAADLSGTEWCEGEVQWFNTKCCIFAREHHLTQLREATASARAEYIAVPINFCFKKPGVWPPVAVVPKYTLSFPTPVLVPGSAHGDAP